MEAELLFSKGRYEIWTGGSFVIDISRNKGESDSAYEARATKEFDGYVDQLRKLKVGDHKKSIKKTFI